MYLCILFLFFVVCVFTCLCVCVCLFAGWFACVLICLFVYEPGSHRQFSFSNVFVFDCFEFCVFACLRACLFFRVFLCWFMMNQLLEEHHCDKHVQPHVELCQACDLLTEWTLTLSLFTASLRNM